MFFFHFAIYFQDNGYSAVVVRPRVCLQKRDESSIKPMADSLLTRLRPLRSGGTPLSFVQLSENDTTTPSKKEDGKGCDKKTNCVFNIKGYTIDLHV